jgi:hypothetical protein
MEGAGLPGLTLERSARQVRVTHAEVLRPAAGTDLVPPLPRVTPPAGTQIPADAATTPAAALATAPLQGPPQRRKRTASELAVRPRGVFRLHLRRARLIPCMLLER